MAAETQELLGKLKVVKQMLTKMDGYTTKQIQMSTEHNQYVNAVTVPRSDYQKYDSHKKLGLIMSITVAVIVFLVLGGLVALFRAPSMKREINDRYELAVANDMMEWNIAHSGENYPGYTGELSEVTWGQAFSYSFKRFGIIIGGIGGVIAFLYFFLCLKSTAEREEHEVNSHNFHVKEEAMATANNNIYYYNQAVELETQIKEIIEQATALQKEYRNYIAGWYPADMSYLEAVNYFISEIENFRADSLKEAQANFIAYKRDERLNRTMEQGFAKIGNKVDNIANILNYQSELLVMNLNNQEIIIRQNDAINRNIMNGFMATNLNMMMSTQAICGQIESSAAMVNKSISNNTYQINSTLKNHR